jgi:hypothetical protein
MPAGADDVRYAGKTGSDWRVVRTTRLTPTRTSFGAYERYTLFVGLSRKLLSRGFDR